MSEYKIKLEVFEGPLELLLHLIEKSKVDIYDISVTVITEQYLSYLKTMEKFNIEIASDFLVMAAKLLYIKSRMLLPKPSIVQDEEETDDPRKELIERLLEYKKFKMLAQQIEEKMVIRSRYFTRPPQEFVTNYVLPVGLKVDDLIAALATLWESNAGDMALIKREEISVQDKMTDIINLLHHSKGTINFSDTIIRSGSKSEVVSSFLALLELIRLKRVEIMQEYSFGPILLSMRKDI